MKFRLSYYRYGSLYYHENNTLEEIATFVDQIMSDNFGAPEELINTKTKEVIFSGFGFSTWADSILKPVPVPEVLKEKVEAEYIEPVLEKKVVKKKRK